MNDAPWSTITTLALYAHFGVTAVVAQERDLLSVPVDQWCIVQDRANGGDVPRLTREESGLNILTGASSILYQRDVSLAGDFTIRIVLHQFDPTRRNEGFGVFFGGESLTFPERQRYSYFLIRQDGSTLVKTRTGRRTAVVRDWAPSTFLHSWEAREPGADIVVNTLMVEARGETVRFHINDQEVWQVTRADVPTQGIIGLRINHGLQVRVAQFVATQH